MEATPDQLTNMDENINAVESVATSNEIGEIMELDNLDLNKLDDDDTNILLQEVYLEYQPIFLLAQLGMDLVFEIGRHLNKPDLAKLLLMDRTVSRHLVVRLRLLQLRHNKSTSVGPGQVGLLAEMGLPKGSSESHPRLRRENSEGAVPFPEVQRNGPQRKNMNM